MTPARFVVAVVDDDPRILESLEGLLEAAGYTARLFASGRELMESDALAAIDCLVSDICMSGMDGFEVRRLARLKRPQLPVILMTGRRSMDKLSELEQDAQHFFLKPLKGDEFLAAIAAALPADA